jgi:enamine deaminase RidA (YjgF/YER057c/UK114 family)
MPQRHNISSGTVWEDIAGYSRAVRIGSQVFVSGTTATDSNGDIVGPHDPYAQTVFIIQKIERALKDAGASLRDVVRTRIFVTDAHQWEVVAKAHAEFFREIRPANTLVEISALIGEGYMVEMEADAVIQDDHS